MTTMTKREYAEAIAKEIGGKVVETTKNNGVVQLGVTTEAPDITIAPVMYVDAAYEYGYPVEQLVSEYNYQLDRVREEGVDYEWAEDYGCAKEMLRVKLVNKAKNMETEVYRSARNYGFPDLIIVPYIDGINVRGNKGTVTVRQSMLDQWGKSKRTVIDQAIRNMENDVVVMPLANKLAEITGDNPAMFKSPFHIVTNKDGRYGAASIIKAKLELETLFHDGYYIIPSSIHEMLVLPIDQGVDDTDLENMIGEVNTYVLDEKDYLSDHLYKFTA